MSLSASLTASHGPASRLRTRLQLMLSAQPKLQTVRRLELTSHLGLLTGHLSPVQSEERGRARAAIDWLLQARANTRDGGVSEGLYSNDQGPYWRPSSPVSTARVTATFSRYVRGVDDLTVRNCIVDMAQLLAAQAKGACARCAATAGETGLSFADGAVVLDGLSEAFAVTGSPATLEAAGALAGFVARQFDLDSGQSLASLAADGACAAALARYGVVAGDRRALEVALGLSERLRARQGPSGWIGSASEASTHALIVAATGMFEAGRANGRPDLVDAARRTAELLMTASLDGRVPGVIPAAGSSTASSFMSVDAGLQLAALLFRLFEVNGVGRLREQAIRYVDLAKAAQIVRGVPLDVRGALPGGVPLLAKDTPLGWPTAAACHFVDAVILQLDRVG